MKGGLDCHRDPSPTAGVQHIHHWICLALAPINGSNAAESDLLDNRSAMGMEMTKYPFLRSMLQSSPKMEEAWLSAVGDGTWVMAFPGDVSFNALRQIWIPGHPHADRMGTGMGDD